MKAQQRGTYTLKTYSSELYTWSPISSTTKISGRPSTGVGCSATAGSQGEDWNVTYVYDIVVVKGKQQRIAYVACDYVL